MQTFYEMKKQTTTQFPRRGKKKKHTVREIPEEESGLLSGLGSLMLLGYYIPPTTRNCLDYLSKTRRIMKNESLLITGPSY